MRTLELFITFPFRRGGRCGHQPALCPFYCGLDPRDIELCEVVLIKATTPRKQSVGVQLLSATSQKRSAENYSAAVVSNGPG